MWSYWTISRKRLEGRNYLNLSAVSLLLSPVVSPHSAYEITPAEARKHVEIERFRRCIRTNHRDAVLEHDQRHQDITLNERAGRPAGGHSRGSASFWLQCIDTLCGGHLSNALKRCHNKPTSVQEGYLHFHIGDTDKQKTVCLSFSRSWVQTPASTQLKTKKAKRPVQKTQLWWGLKATHSKLM